MTARVSWAVIGATILLGFALFLWGAFAAPVVQWVDSEIDLAWAHEGIGIWKPVPLPPDGTPLGHLPKPAYLLFLRGAAHVFPFAGEARSIVLTQSIMLALSIAGVGLRIARRRGARAGLTLVLLCLVFFRLRNASSAVMSEALAAALLLPIAALLLDPPRRSWAFALLGLAAAVLFFVRPNCGGVALALAIASFLVSRRGKPLVLFLLGFLALAVPVWYLARADTPGDPLHGLGYQIVEASAEYYWAPAIGPWPRGSSPGELAKAELRMAARNWKRLLSAPRADRSRELAWRGLHGLFGVEYYDARWSRSYQSLSTASQVASPFLILGALALLLVMPWREESRIPKAMGLLLLGLFILQDLVIGSNPRYVLPLLPVLFLLAACGAPHLLRAAPRPWIGYVVLLGALCGLAAWQRGILDWQWGQIERAGVTIRQEIPRGALPPRSPATLHIRIATTLPSSSAHLTVSAEGILLFSSVSAAGRERPEITAPLPPDLLEKNGRGPIDLVLTSTGDYGPYAFLLFPIVPPPWERPARRDGGPGLSPSTAIQSGGLDWWVHESQP